MPTFGYTMLIVYTILENLQKLNPSAGMKFIWEQRIVDFLFIKSNIPIEFLQLPDGCEMDISKELISFNGHGCKIKCQP